jgi:quinolinate synthase
MADIIGEISRRKDERNASILAHNYQPGQIQDIADLVGDSLELSRAASNMGSEVLIFCGVDFMAETASILSPEKAVIQPASGASCPMAHMITAEQLREMKAIYPDAAVVCYVNSTAEVKAESDVCCTSANGIKVANSLDEDQIIFVPDRNLAAYVARHSRKEIIPWNGFCYIHDSFTPEEVLKAKRLHPRAEIMVHPECRPEVLDLADGVFSTAGMAKHAKESPVQEFIIGTEMGMLYRLEKENPSKQFYPLSKGAICRDMKKTSLEQVLQSLETLGPRVTVPKDIADRARKAIERMISI